MEKVNRGEEWSQRNVPVLTDEDLRFVVETVGDERSGMGQGLDHLRAREDLLDVLLEDDRLVRSLLEDTRALLRVSPALVFSVFLRRVIRDLNARPYTLERTPETVAVFDATRVHRFVAEPAIWGYLVRMLTSFIRTETVTVFTKEGQRYRRRRFSTLNLETIIELAGLVGERETPPIFQRIADIALFTSGIFPDYLRSRRGRAAREHWRAIPLTAETYEEHGRRFYRLAAGPEGRPNRRVLTALADEFPMARKVLELLSDRYLRWTRLSWFHMPC